MTEKLASATAMIRVNTRQAAGVADELQKLSVVHGVRITTRREGRRQFPAIRILNFKI